MLQYHSPDGATAAVFNDSLIVISRHFRVSISAKRLIIGQIGDLKVSKENLLDRAHVTVSG